MFIQTHLDQSQKFQWASRVLVHDVVDQFGVKWHLDASQSVFYLVEIVTLGLFVGPEPMLDQNNTYFVMKVSIVSEIP